MGHLDQKLAERLEALQAAGLLRQLREVGSPQGPEIVVQGKGLLNFSSNDYLGLANDPILRQAAAEAARRYGAGSGASRLISGSLAVHHELESELARFKQTEAALTFSSGYATALGVIPALVGKEDVVVIDRLVHASIVDAARLSGATLRVFRHNDVDDLGSILAWAAPRQVLVVTESVFSMDGDVAPLQAIVEMKKRHGAWLMVDEAHATGVLGTNGRGWAQELGVGEAIEIQMGTLGKALGAAGGFVAGSSILCSYLLNRARSFVFSTAPSPPAAAAALAAVRFLASPAGDQRRRLLWENVRRLHDRLSPRSGEPGAGPASAIFPVMVGDETRAVEMAVALREQGFFVPAIRYPTVARRQARLRVTVTAGHQPGQVERLAEALVRALAPGEKAGLP